MEGIEFKACLKKLDLTQERFARDLGISLRSVQYWCRQGPPPAVSELVRHMLTARIPPPSGSSDAATARELHPRLDALCGAMLKAGWNLDAVLRAVAGWASSRADGRGQAD